MKKNAFLYLLFALTCFAGKSFAQKLPCYTDEVRKRLIAIHPEILQYEADFNRQIKEGISRIDLGKVAHTASMDETGNIAFWYDIPIVVHIVHDYNRLTEYLTDDAVYNDLIDWNIVYAAAN